EVFLRPTLQEVWRFYNVRGRIPKFDELTRYLPETYLFGDRVKYYPRPLRRKILQHEKILGEILDGRRNELNSLLPALINQYNR
ncbi:MAG: hypothetical protein QXH24_00410, partial [Candidatus Bathyarchaeia archaeon]